MYWFYDDRRDFSFFFIDMYTISSKKRVWIFKIKKVFCSKLDANLSKYFLLKKL